MFESAQKKRLSARILGELLDSCWRTNYHKMTKDLLQFMTIKLGRLHDPCNVAQIFFSL